MNDIQNRVQVIIGEQLKMEADTITPEKLFLDDLAADSLDSVEIVLALEEEFNFQVKDEDVEKIISVQNAIDYVIANKQEKKAEEELPKEKI
jgi:acyl carrier protein